MQIKLSEAFCFALLIMSSSASSFAQQSEEFGWTSLSAGQTAFEIHYRKDRMVAIGDRNITRCSNTWTTVDISALSTKKRLAIVMCDEEDARNKAYVVAISGQRVLFPLSIKNAVFDKWVAWSPDERFALLATGGEGFQGEMLLVNLTSGVTRKIDFKRLGLKGETEVLDEGATSWLSETSFRMKFNVVCQVFDDNPRCASGPCRECDNGIHRTYWARVNLNPFSITYSSSQPAVSRPSAPPRSKSGSRQIGAGNDCEFCGAWKAVVGGRKMGGRPDDYAGKTGNPYCGCDYLRITKTATGKFKLDIGSEYQGKINWTADGDKVINNSDAVYLAARNGRLTARFVSPNFYATHGKDFTYVITCELNGNQLLFSVSMIGGQTERATYVKVNE